MSPQPHHLRPDLGRGSSRQLTLLSAGYFKKDFEAYLADLDFAPVKSLEELVQFNRDHADQELPPREQISETWPQLLVTDEM